MRNSILVIALPFLTIACSASFGSAPSTAPPGDSGAAEALTPQSVEAGPDPIPDPTGCDLDRGVQCTICCGTTFADGVQYYLLAQQDCVCGGASAGMSSCASSCSYSDCIALDSSDPTCAACLQGAVTRCQPQIRATCNADPYCRGYLTCVSRCME